MKWETVSGGSHFWKRGGKDLLQLCGYHAAQPLQEGLFKGTGKEAPADWWRIQEEIEGEQCSPHPRWKTSLISLILEEYCRGHGVCPLICVFFNFGNGLWPYPIGCLEGEHFWNARCWGHWNSTCLPEWSCVCIHRNESKDIWHWAPPRFVPYNFNVKI